MNPQQPQPVVAKLGPVVPAIVGGRGWPRKDGIPVTNSQGKVEYFRNVDRDLLRHLGVIIKE